MRPRKGQQAPPPPAEAPDPTDQINALLDEFGALDISIQLQRQSTTPPRRYQYIGTVPFTSDLVDQVQLQYGGGDYKGLVFRGTEYVKGRTLTFSIAGKARAFADADEPAQSDTLTVLREEIRQLREQPKEDPIERMVKVFTSIAAAVTPIIAPLLANRGGGDGQSVTETLALMQAAESKGEERGRELGKLLAGHQGDGVADVVKGYLPHIIPLLQRQATRENPAPAAVALPAVTVPTPIPAAPPVQEVFAPEYDWLPAVRPIYARLLQQAQHNTNVTLVAEFAFSQMDPSLEDAIARASQRDDFRATMQRELAPIIEHHPEWADDFITACIEQGKPETAPMPLRKVGGKKP